ncbi:MAG: dockerin type I domain-containing protein [Fervidobacterium sp.]
MLHVTFLTLIILTIIITQEKLFHQKILQKASAIYATAQIGVYWDQNCTKPVTSINWGVLSPGDNKNITLYTRNEDNANTILTISPINWNPEEAREFLTLSCTQNNTTIEPQKTIKITLTLQIKQNTRNIQDFSFDIIFEGKTREFLPTDLNKDGIVDLMDIVILASAYGSKPGDPNWNEIADINKDGRVDMKDLMAVILDYGKTS